MGREAAVMDWEQTFPFLREKGHVVSLVGGGGKTTLLYALSAHCAAKGWRVLTSTTTHIRKPLNVSWIAVEEEERIQEETTAPLERAININKKAQHEKGVWEDAVDKKTICEDSECKMSASVEGVSENAAWENAGKERDRLWQQGTYVVAGTPALHEKLTILPEQIRNTWISDADITFLEADGAKRLPCKFPAAHEPVLLPQSDIVLAVAGLSALYRPLGEVCFRAELACEEWNRAMRECREAAYQKEGKRRFKEVPIFPQANAQEEPIFSKEAQLPCETFFSKFSKEMFISKDTSLTPELLAWLLGSENGARKDIAGRSFFVVLNQTDTPKLREDGRKILDILERTYGIRGVLTSFSETERNQE